MADAASPVLMIRNLPSGVTGQELQDWASAFCYSEDAQRHLTCVATYVATRADGSHVGFVQMLSAAEANRIMTLYKMQPSMVQIRSCPVNIIFSDKQQITALHRHGQHSPVRTGAAAGGELVRYSATELGGPCAGIRDKKPILLVVVKDLQGLVAHDDLFWLLSQFGIVEKLSYFEKEGQAQVLAQFHGIQTAGMAMAFLNGKRIRLPEVYVEGVDLGMESGIVGAPEGTTHWVSFTGRQLEAQLAIVPSRLESLEFQNNDVRNMNYGAVNGPLAAFFESCMLDQASLGEVSASFGELVQQYPWWRPLGFVWCHWLAGSGWLSPSVQEQGDGARGPVMQTQLPAAVFPGQSPPLSEAWARFAMPQDAHGCVVHLSGLIAQGGPWPSPPWITPRTVWALGSAYGDLVAVKLLFKHPGCALLQYETPEGARCALDNLDSALLYDRRWRASLSLHANAMYWSGAQTELGAFMLTKWDGQGPLPRPPHQSQCWPPNKNLHLWDLPRRVSLRRVHDLLNEALARVLPGEQCAVLNVQWAQEGDGGHGHSHQSGVIAGTTSADVACALLTHLNGTPLDIANPAGPRWHMHFATAARPRRDPRRSEPRQSLPLLTAPPLQRPPPTSYAGSYAGNYAGRGRRGQGPETREHRERRRNRQPPPPWPQPEAAAAAGPPAPWEEPLPSYPAGAAVTVHQSAAPNAYGGIHTHSTVYLVRQSFSPPSAPVVMPQLQTLLPQQLQALPPQQLAAYHWQHIEQAAADAPFSPPLPPATYGFEATVHEAAGWPAQQPPPPPLGEPHPAPGTVIPEWPPSSPPMLRTEHSPGCTPYTPPTARTSPSWAEQRQPDASPGMFRHTHTGSPPPLPPPTPDWHPGPCAEPAAAAGTGSPCQARAFSPQQDVTTPPTLCACPSTPPPQPPGRRYQREQQGRCAAGPSLAASAPAAPSATGQPDPQQEQQQQQQRQPSARRALVPAPIATPGSSGESADREPRAPPPSPEAPASGGPVTCG